MNTLLFAGLLFTLLFLLLSGNNTPSNAFSFAMAGMPKQSGFKNLLYTASALVFELATDIKEELGNISKGLNDLVKKAQEEAKTAFEKAATKEEIEKIKADHQKRFDEYAEKNDERFKKLQDQADALETKSKRPSAGQDKTKSFEDSLGEMLESKKSELSAKRKQNGGSFLEFEIKAAANMTIGTNYSGGTVGLTTWDSEIARPPQRRPFLRQLVSNRPVSSLYVAWAEMANRDGAADTVAEGAKKPQIDFDIVEASKKVEKIAAFIKASKESLDDIPYLRSEINQELGEQINLKLDQQIYSGDGTTPNLKGIITYAPTISVVGLPFATGVVTPNRADALVVAEAVVQNSLYTPNYALVNPLDLAMMRLSKNADGDSVNQVYVADNFLMVGGLRIVANTGVPVGNFLVGDFSKDILGIREELNIQIGYENDDFTKNLVTILGEMRAVNYIKSQHVNAFVKGVFATVITAITKA